MKRLVIALTICSVAATAASAEVVKGSREYTRLKKQVQDDRKNLITDRQEVAEFSSLLREMESADPKETSRYYWNLDNQVRVAMDREYEQIQKEPGRDTNVRAQGASVPGMDALSDLDESSVMTISPQRAERMKLIMAESKGLKHAMTNGDRDARGRYHHLLAEFLGIMRAEAEDTADAISARENELR